MLVSSRILLTGMYFNAVLVIVSSSRAFFRGSFLISDCIVSGEMNIWGRLILVAFICLTVVVTSLIFRPEFRVN